MAAKIFFTSQILAISNMIYLSYIHFTLKYGHGEKSLCNISEGLNCDVVNTSQYSLFMGTPVSIWGLFVNLILLYVGLSTAVSNDEDRKKRTQNIIVWGSLFVVLSSIVMAIISFTKLNTFCLFCIFGYALSLITLFAAIKWRGRFSPSSIGDDLVFLTRKGQGLAFLVSGLLVIPLSLIANDMVLKRFTSMSPATIQSFISSWKESPQISFNTNGALVFQSAKSPKMTITEFADFQCIHCKMASPIIHNFVRSRDDIQLVFQYFPLDGTCNEAISRPGNGRSCQFAYATYCANQQGVGWAMHDWIFEAYQEAKVSDLTQKAVGFGAEKAKFEACMASNETADAVKAQAKAGKDSGVQGTPAIFVNGKRLEYGQSWQVLEAVYKSL